MQTHTLLGCIITVLSICQSSEYLAVIKDLPADCRHEYFVFRQIGADYLAIAGDGDIDRLKTERIAYSILDTDPRGKAYFLIANSAANDPELMRYGKLLRRYDHFFLFRTTVEHCEEVRGVPVRMERLRFTPVTFGDQASLKLPPAPRIPNPLIEQILKDVSIDTLRSYVKKLQSFKTRHASTAENKTVVCPWLASVLQSYCDSVYQQPVPSYGPNVIGIKKGIKNPSVTKHCLIGAHLDAVVTNGPFGAAGADDNGSGTAGVLECARIFKKYSFENTVVFALFNAEEVGLVGSGQLAKYIKSNGHTLIGGVMTYDQAGHSTSSTKDILWLESVGNSEACKNFITGYMKGIVDTYLHMKTEYSLQGAGTDYVNFSNAGYVAGLVGEKAWDHPAYHKNFDTLDCPVGMNDMQLFQNIIKTGTAAIADMAVPLSITSVAGPPAAGGFSVETRFDRIRGGVVHIAVSGAPGRTFNAAIYSLQGKIVRSLGTAYFDAMKTVSLPLSGRGEPIVSHGIYHIRLANGDLRLSRPIVVF